MSMRKIRIGIFGESAFLTIVLLTSIFGCIGFYFWVSRKMPGAHWMIWPTMIISLIRSTFFEYVPNGLLTPEEMRIRIMDETSISIKIKEKYKMKFPFRKIRLFSDQNYSYRALGLFFTLPFFLLSTCRLLIHWNNLEHEWGIVFFFYLMLFLFLVFILSNLILDFTAESIDEAIKKDAEYGFEPILKRMEGEPKNENKRAN